MAEFGARPSVGRRWYKAHGLGNDYLIFEEGRDWRAEPAQVARVCHRWEGVGGDGIVVLCAAGDRFVLRMFNPDGSEFERSGNGLRVLAAFLHQRGLVREAPFEVEMGRARVGAAAVELDPKALDGDGRIAHPDAGKVAIVPVSVGNPHAVVFADALRGSFDPITWHRLAPGLATHRSFAHGTNVQLVRVVAPNAIEILIWERGVGPTTASGTSACASAVAAVSSGRIPPGEVEVRMEGGSFRVGVSADLDVVLRGPVREVGTGELAETFVKGLA